MGVMCVLFVLTRNSQRGCRRTGLSFLLKASTGTMYTLGSKVEKSQSTESFLSLSILKRHINKLLSLDLQKVLRLQSTVYGLVLVR